MKQHVWVNDAWSASFIALYVQRDKKLLTESTFAQSAVTVNTPSGKLGMQSL
jgi:hypothetical protein